MKKIVCFLLMALMLIGTVGCKKPVDTPVDIIGDPTAQPTERPVIEVDFGQPINTGSILTCSTHTAALRTDGAVLTAGRNDFGQRNVSSWKNIVQIAVATDSTAGVVSDGTVVLTGKLASSCNVASWKDVVRVAVSDTHIVGLKLDGTVLTSGSSSCDASSAAGISSIAAGSGFTLCLASDGSVSAFGSAPDVSAWNGVLQIAASGDAAAALKADGTVVTTLAADTSAWTNVQSIALSNGILSAVTSDGKVLSNAETLFTSESDVRAVEAAVGSDYQLVMDAEGSVIAYGDPDNRQTAVFAWNLRASKDANGYVTGLPANTACESIKKVIGALAGLESVTVKSGGEELADDAIVGTGAEIYDGDTLYGTVVIKGDLNGDGSISNTDVELITKYGNGSIDLHGAFIEAAKLFESGSPFQHINKHSRGTGVLSQFPITDPYMEKYQAALDKNDDVMGYIAVDGTVIDYPILCDASGKWFYNYHDIDGNESDGGSIYSWQRNLWKNNTITGHNMRVAKTMFHALHDLQDNKESLLTFKNRVIGITIEGTYMEFEIFALYETPHEEPTSTILYNGNSLYEYTDSEVQEWINKQLQRSEIDLGVSVSPSDTFVTLYTCGDEYGYAEAQSRLYFFLRRIA